MRKIDGNIVFSPSDLITYLKSPFASWMDRYRLEGVGDVEPDEETEDQKLIAEMGVRHESAVLEEFQTDGVGLAHLGGLDLAESIERTKETIEARTPIIYQAALASENFAGLSDFLMLGDNDSYEVWDTKLARTPKPYYAIQLCCYSEMLAATIGEDLPERFGVILGSKDRVTFWVEDFIHYYRRVKNSFLAMQNSFDGDLARRPEPHARGDHGRWTSHADKYLDDVDHLVRVAGITVGQIKKLKASGINTLAELAAAEGQNVAMMLSETLTNLVQQARLQHDTRSDRANDSEAPARLEVLPNANPYEDTGLFALPEANAADVFFDMEGYPLVEGGLEYLFGATIIDPQTGQLTFNDWWAHDRAEEKAAFEVFIDWAFGRWRANPGMHIYHYAAYEETALKRLSTFHNTRQDELDDLLRAEVFTDLYKIVRQGVRIGEENYSIKTVEKLYRLGRNTEVATATDSIVQYGRWMESGEPRAWSDSPILTGIRDYNKDDCDSTAELTFWLRDLADKNGIPRSTGKKATNSATNQPTDAPPDLLARLEIVDKLKAKGDPIALALADLVDFHRREQKPRFWKMFERADSSDETLADDNGCIAGVVKVGEPVPEKKSLLQEYSFDPAQECKLRAEDRVMFTHQIFPDMEIFEIDAKAGVLKLKATQKTLDTAFDGAFPESGSLIESESINIKPLQTAISEVGQAYIDDTFSASSRALLERTPPSVEMRREGEDTINAAIRIAGAMDGGCLLIQGPPGTGKTYTASHVIATLVAAGKRVGVTSNSHKAIVNLLTACGAAIREADGTLRGVKVGDSNEGPLFEQNPNFQHVDQTKDAATRYSEGILGGTVWLFARSEWKGGLDYLFVDEAGQMSLANVVAASRSAKNLVLLGDQMQLEQPIQGSHPGDSGMSALQYALKDISTSKPDAAEFHAVVPAELGLFLGESRRMHPEVCQFISESIYEQRLTSHETCAAQRIALPDTGGELIKKEAGIVFSGVQHDGNIQRSEEEAARVKAVYEDLFGREYTAADGTTRALTLADFLFIAPYNAQVRTLEEILPAGARIGSVDRFQGQEAPVCILSLCSSVGEYGTRGLRFILDRNRINVAISRAQCLGVVVADPRIAGADAASLNEMKLLNIFCKIANNSVI